MSLNMPLVGRGLFKIYMLSSPGLYHSKESTRLLLNRNYSYIITEI
jgi:hypothetical protein